LRNDAKCSIRRLRISAKWNHTGLQNLLNVRKHTTETREMFNQMAAKYIEIFNQMVAIFEILTPEIPRICCSKTQ
jgi:hypothetical protein